MNSPFRISTLCLARTPNERDDDDDDDDDDGGGGGGDDDCMVTVPCGGKCYTLCKPSRNAITAITVCLIVPLARDILDLIARNANNSVTVLLLRRNAMLTS